MVRTIVAAAIACWLGVCGAAQAQDWPARPITMVVPYAAGGRSTPSRGSLPRA